MLGSAVSGSFCTMLHYVLPRYTKQNPSDHGSMADKIRSKRRFGADLYSTEMIQPGSLLLTNNEQDFHSSSETNPPTPRRNCIQKISPRSHSDAVAPGLPPRTHAVLFTGPATVDELQTAHPAVLGSTRKWLTISARQGRLQCG